MNISGSGTLSMSVSHGPPPSADHSLACGLAMRREAVVGVF